MGCRRRQALTHELRVTGNRFVGVYKVEKDILVFRHFLANG